MSESNPPLTRKSEKSVLPISWRTKGRRGNTNTTISRSHSRNSHDGAFRAGHESRTRHPIFMKRSKLKICKKIHASCIDKPFNWTLRLGITNVGGVTMKVVTAALQRSRYHLHISLSNWVTMESIH